MIKKEKLKEMFAGVNIDIEERWEKGIGHHPEAEKLAKIIEALDWHYASDSLGLKFGGDGDNGETLLYMLDIYFESLDLKNSKERK